MSSNCPKPVLFLDTPRAGEGLNHRFFVASPPDCDEEEINGYAVRARKTPDGSDYISCSRQVLQITRGQIRDGLELLVLAGVAMDNPSMTSRVRERMISMLSTLPDFPVPVHGPPSLLIHSDQIEGFERELRGEVAAVSCGSEKSMPYQTPSSPKAIRRIPMKLICIALFACIVICTCLFASHIRQVGKNKDSSGKANTKQGSGQTTATGDMRRIPGTIADWKFLDEPEWKNLASVTGLPPGADDEAKSRWAGALLIEAEPGCHARNPCRDIQRNDNVKLLLNAVPPSGDSSKADAVSKKWIELRGGQAEGLSEFWTALNERFGKRPGGIISSMRMKELLREWGQTINEKGQTATVTTEIQILMEADLQRFLHVQEFMNGDEFISDIGKSAWGKDWKQSSWLDRLEKLDGLSKDGKLEKDDRPTKELCAKLYGALGQ